MQSDTSLDSITIPVIYIEVFVLMFVSFIIGYLFAFFYQKSRYEKNFTYTEEFNKEPDEDVTKSKASPSEKAKYSEKDLIDSNKKNS